MLIRKTKTDKWIKNKKMRMKTKIKNKTKEAIKA
jgi:hypothetical protein